jgi:hypothetical protein
MEPWPALPPPETFATLHMWLQMAGKTMVALAPRQPHWWHVGLHLTSCGLTTGPLPTRRGPIEVSFDLLRDALVVELAGGDAHAITLGPRSVADLYAEYLAVLDALGVAVPIRTRPVEVPDPIPFEQDHVHDFYDARSIRALHRVLLSTADVMGRWRQGFVGKSSPILFWWGGFDLSCSLFSGRRAPSVAGLNAIEREAFSHEQIEIGFWPGGGAVDAAAFYVHVVPEPAGLRSAPLVDGATWVENIGPVLPYVEVRAAADADARLLSFWRRAYVAAATRAGWDRAALEREGSWPLDDGDALPLGAGG